MDRLSRFLEHAKASDRKWLGFRERTTQRQRMFWHAGSCVDPVRCDRRLGPLPAIKLVKSDVSVFGHLQSLLPKCGELERVGIIAEGLGMRNPYPQTEARLDRAVPNS